MIAHAGYKGSLAKMGIRILDYDCVQGLKRGELEILA